MSNYDFRSLSPVDFENLIRDLLQAEEGIRIETFAPGRDQGIDLRYAVGTSNMLVQAKHYRDSGISKLMTALRKELPKIRALNPTRYIVATSVSLTPSNKQEIIDVFDPYIRQSADVLGAEDLNALLERHSKVHLLHFKLWITSANVLQRVLHGATYARSEEEAEKIEQTARLFVANPSVQAALALLDKYRFLIISGPPGVGKSTLARIVAWLHMQSDWQLVSVEDFDEALDVFHPSQRQIFFYDDFLGQIRLPRGVIHRADKGLLQFIQRVERAKNTKFVVTSREYILKQAQQVSEKLSENSVNLRKYVLDVSEYTRGVRAHIFYNHVYFSDIPPEYRDCLLSGDFFLSIIDHKNFVPRLIEFVTAPANFASLRPAQYQAWVKESLDNPQRIWAHPYREHLSQPAKNLVATLFFMPENLEILRLRQAFEKINNAVATQHNSSFDPEDFRRAIQEVSGSFVQVVNGRASLANPSIRDFLDRELLESDFVRYVLCNLCMSEQAEAAQRHIEAHDQKYSSSGSSWLPGALEAGAKSLASVPFSRVIQLTGGGHVSTAEGISLLARVAILLKWWTIKRSPAIAAALHLVSSTLRTETFWESDLSESLDVLDLALDPTYTSLPGREAILEELTHRAIFQPAESRQPDVQHLNAVQDYLNDHRDYEIDGAREAIERAIVRVIDDIAGTLRNMSTSAEVYEARDILISMAGARDRDIDVVSQKIDEREVELDEDEDRYSIERAPLRYNKPSVEEMNDDAVRSMFKTLQ
jgi:hypothetical protein